LIRPFVIGMVVQSELPSTYEHNPAGIWILLSAITEAARSSPETTAATFMAKS